MMHLFDRATMAHALTLDLDPQLRSLLNHRIAALTDDLRDYTEYLVVEAGDQEADIVRHIGFSPLVEPINGVRFGGPDFQPHWDYLAAHQGWFEMIVTFGSAFANVLLIQDDQRKSSEIVKLCRYYA